MKSLENQSYFSRIKNRFQGNSHLGPCPGESSAVWACRCGRTKKGRTGQNGQPG